MRRVVRPVVALLALAVTGGGAAAQGDTPATTPETIQSQVLESTAVAGGRAQARIDRGALQGISLGAKGLLSLDGAVVGDAVAIDVEDDWALVDLTMREGAAPVEAGHLVQLTVPLPRRPRSVLWRLATVHVVFRGRESESPYFTIESLREDEAPDLVETVLAAMAAQVRETGTAFGDRLPPDPVPKGRFAGRSIAQAMQGATADDVRVFCEFVADFPGKYMATVWQVDETFATWVKNGAPHGARAVVHQLLAAADATAAATTLREECQTHDVAEFCADEARDALRRGHPVADVVALATAGAAVAAVCAQPGFRADALEVRAEAQEAAGNGAAGLADWREALAVRSAATGLTAIAPLVRLAITLTRRGHAEPAEAAFAAGARLASAGGTEAYAYALLLRVEGQKQLDAGALQGALVLLTRSVQAFEGSPERESAWRALLSLGNCLAELGRIPEALPHYDRVRDEAKAAGNREMEARAIERVGLRCIELGDYERAAERYTVALAIRRALGAPGPLAGTLHALGMVQRCLGAHDACAATNEEALRLRRELGDREGEGDTLTQLGRLYRKTGRWAEALERFQQAMAIQRELRRFDDVAQRLVDIAGLRTELKEYAAALDEYGEAVTIARAIADAGVEADALTARLELHIKLQDFVAARTDGAAAVAVVRRLGDRQREVTTLQRMADVHGRTREFDQARTLALESRTIAEANGLRLEAAHSHRLEGLLFAQEYRTGDARAAYERALALYRAIDDPWELAVTLQGYGNTLENAGDFPGALARYQEAHALAQAKGFAALSVWTLGAIGSAQLSLGRIAEAHAAAEQARAAADASGTSWLRAGARHDLARVLSARGEAGPAIAVQDEALALYRADRNDWGVAAILNNRAGDFIVRGEYARALTDLETALELAAASGDPMLESGVRSTRARALGELGRAPEALAELDASIEISRRIGHLRFLAGQLAERGRRQLALGALEPAGAALHEALALQRQMQAPLAEAEVLELQAQVHLAAGDLASAREAANAGLALAAGSGAREVLWRLHVVASQVAEREGDLARAAQQRRAGVAILDEMLEVVGGGPAERERFLRSKVAVYESMAELLGRLSDAADDPGRRKGLIDEALTCLSRARFTVVQDTVRGGGSGDPAHEALVARREAALRAVAQLETQLSDARKTGNTGRADQFAEVLARSVEDLVRVNVDLRAEDPDFDARAKFDPPDLDMQARSLPEGARLVVYLTGAQHCQIWVYARSGFVTWTRVPVARARVDALVGEYRALNREVMGQLATSKGRGFGPAAEADPKNPEWYRTNIARMRAVCTQLYAWLVAPVAEHLASADPLVIMPYGRLCYLPFESLLTPSGEFLGEQRRVAYFVHDKHLAKGLERLALPAPRRDSAWVAYADPVGKLRDALEEASEIQALFPTHTVHSQATGTATEDQLATLDAGCTVLHLATHGYLNAERPSETWLELAKGATQDGRLTYAEVAVRLKQLAPIKSGHLRLVVLSACDTAVGHDSPQAEVLSMPDAFQRAGAPTVIASLWPVYTWSTTDLMVEFYKRYAAGQDPAGALRDARKTLLVDRATARYAHPYFWSPFLLFGDWR